jgi:YVTN family beta-propeller protein
MRAILLFFLALAASASAQVTTSGFLNLPRTEAAGTLLSHPVDNGSEPIGRTTSINYLNGWIIIGAEQPGSRQGSDWEMRVYDVSNPTGLVRRLPTDFNLSYPNNSWHFGNVGWNAHGTAQSGNLLLPNVVRVNGFSGLVERGGTNGIPQNGQLLTGYNRASQAGPWDASFPWYGSPDSIFTINEVYQNGNGGTSFRPLASFDHVGSYGGGDWHPMFFGDLLIYARSGSAARDGVVVYRMIYNNYDDPNTRSITPQYVGSLAGGFEGYWPTFFSDGTGLYVIGAATDVVMAADITQASHPAGDGSVNLVRRLVVPGMTNAPYPVYQDNFGFMHNRKIDMTRLIAGDANPITLTLNEANPPRAAAVTSTTGVDTTQMSLALGNLWLTGGYPHGSQNQGLGVWVHQQAADTVAPRVSYHIPQVNRTNYPRHAPLSFLLHEHPRSGGPRNGIDFSVRPVQAGNTLGAFVPGYLIHDFSGVCTFTPSAGLIADTTYQVDFLSDPANQIGFRDAAGNYIEPYSFRFSTGGGINAVVPPSFTSVTADNYQPAPGAQITVSAAASGTGPLEYRFNFTGTYSAWSSTASASFAYTTAGRPRVLVQVRDSAGNVVTQSLTLLVIAAPVQGARPTQSSTLCVGADPAGRRVWSVNPDANTVTVLDAITGAKVAEHAVGQNPRSIARDANGRYWVTCLQSDEIRILNADGSPFQTLSLPYGSAPFAVAASPDGQQLFVTLYGAGSLHRYSAANPSAAAVIRSTFPTPRAIAISADGTRVLVTRFISPELEAEIGEFAGTSPTLTLTRIMPLVSANPTDGGDRASGVPNYLAGIAISPDGTRAAVVSKQDNIQRGLRFGVNDLTHETTVRSVISFLNLTTNTEIQHTRRDFDNSDSPSAVTYTPLGDTLLVTIQGNNTLVGVDALNITPLDTNNNTPASTETSPAVIAFEIGTGLAPQGVLVDPVANRIFTQNFMGRSVTVLNGQPLLVENRTSLPLVTMTATVSTELLSATVLLGKQIFYNAADPRMDADSYISCATCHLDGGHDGRVWDFTGRTEGLRRTTDLRGRSGMGHGAVHWSGNFDEIQDFEHDIRGPFGGTGFLNLTPTQFATLHASPATGKTGLSPELDALAAYVTSLSNSHVPKSPLRNSNGSLTAAAVRGQAVFAAENCASCHSGNAFTNSTLTNVGTQSLLSGSRLGQTLPGIDTPTLHGLHAARSYLHHGQADTLSDVFAYGGGTLLQAAQAQRLTTVNAAAIELSTDSPAQGGGGFYRGAIGGTSLRISEESGAATPPGLRFNNVDGGPAGGAARIGMRYVLQYGNGSATLRVNGVSQTLTLLRQYPDNGWQTSGWQWVYANATLNPGSTNTVEILRTSSDVEVNVLLISNAAQLTLAAPHRRVLTRTQGDRDDLTAYLRQLDGRDASGVTLADPAQPLPGAPSILTAPASRTLAEGNALLLSVAVAGTGPFTYEWRRGATVIGSNSPQLAISSTTLSDSGSYTVRVTNAQGNVTSPAATITVNASLSIATSALAVTTVGRSYITALSATGGIDTRVWSLTGGTLPPGLNLSLSGVISGQPTAPAKAQLTFRVADSSGSATRVLSLDVRPIGGFVSDPDLVLHYTFDEGNGTRVWDAAPTGNNHTTDVTGAHWISSGRFGGAYGPSSTSATVFAFTPTNQSDLDFNPRGDPFTLSIWVRTTQTGGYSTVISKDLDVSPWDNTQYRIWTGGSPNSLWPASGNQFGSTLNVSAPALNNGDWHLLTLVNYLDGATWRSRLYYDNGSVYTQFNTGAAARVPSLMRVGDTSRGWNGWNGQLDDLRIYRRALSQTEIATLFSPPPIESYDTWLAALANPPTSGQRGLTDDPDQDGSENLLEYALGNHPNTAANIAQVTYSRTATHFRLHYPRLRSDLIYTVETSTDLLTWTTLNVLQDTTTPLGQTATATVPAAPGAVRSFLRLRVTER